MGPRALWADNPSFIEIGATDATLALALAHEGYSKYLGVAGNARRVARIKARHPDFAGQFTCSQRRRLVLHNDADVLVLSGWRQVFVWKFRSVRHARYVAWPLKLSPMCLVALLGCLWHLLAKSYGWPRIVALSRADGRTARLLVARVRRQKRCYRDALHFIPHVQGLRGVFREFDRQGVRYVVLRWFDNLPDLGPNDDVDLLIDDRSLTTALGILHGQPGIVPCDVYSETGLARSTYLGVPYYPAHVARKILDRAVRHKDLCMVPDAWAHFHSLAYHAVYHKGLRSGLPRGETGLPPRGEPGHDYTATLQAMADRLGIDVEISLEGLHSYLQQTGWGPSPEMLARHSMTCRGNRWLRMLSERLEPHVHDQGLTAFVLREEAVRRGYQDRMIAMIAEGGFEILATKTLAPDEVEYAAARTRGGNWGTGLGPYNLVGGPPAAVVVAYDAHPIAPNRKQRRKFPQRTNARIFLKESIRDRILAELPPGEGCNAIHSSDHAAEAWHLIEVLAPELMDTIRGAVRQRRGGVVPRPVSQPARQELRRAA